MEENITTTPVIDNTLNTTEVNQIVETTEQDNVSQDWQNQEVKKKVPQYVPYHVVSEKSATIKALRQQVADLERKGREYDAHVALLEQHPDYAERIKQVSDEYFSNKGNEYEDYGDNTHEIGQITKRLEEIENRQIKLEVEKRLDAELTNVMREAKNQGDIITEKELYKVMLDYNIQSPKAAYLILKGTKIPEYRKVWEQDYVRRAKSVPPGTASVEGVLGTLQVKTPQDFAEASQMVRQDLQSGRIRFIE